jgi:hypothetical protein
MNRATRLRPVVLTLVRLVSAACFGPPADRSPGPRRQPKPGTAWQWQLDGRIDTGVP